MSGRNTAHIFYGDINMKRTVAIFLTFAVLFLCACSAEKTQPDTPAKSTTEYVSADLTTAPPPTTVPVIISEWGTDLLPKKFPAPPDGTYAFEAEKCEKGKYNTHYASDSFTRIYFTCPEQNFYYFTNSMKELGYLGASKKITNGTFYINGYRGLWQDGKNIVLINSTANTGENEINVVMDIVPCAAATSDDPLKDIFPVFKGYSTGSEYRGYDAGETLLEDEYTNSFPPYWFWQHRFSNSFVGVSYEEFEAYREALEKREFSGVIKASTVDGCNMLSMDVTKTADDETYAVLLLFNQTLKTLDIVYTNNPDLFMSN